MAYKQDPPFCVQIEMTEGCNLYCDFCGLQGIRSKEVKNFKFLTIKLAERISSEIAKAGWNSRIEFAMHGEPTMNPKFTDVVSVFRSNLPKSQLMMTSNGGGLLGSKMIEKLFDAGLNVLAVDCYEYVKIGDKLKKRKYEEPIDVHRYPEELSASPHKRWGKKDKVLIFVKDISSANDGNHATLNNHCGAGAPPNNKAQGKQCAKPFRELSIRWDGSIAICCNDWRGEYKCGSIKRQAIDEIWQGRHFQTARKYLYHGRRELKPCEGCDALSYRVGLLPDKLGKKKLPKPNYNDKTIVKRATSGRPLTKPVKRPWE